MKRLRLDAILFAAGILLLWQIAADLKLVSPIFFPSPWRTLNELYEQFADGSIWRPLQQTTLRMIYGWIAACLLGVFLGSLIGLSRTARDYLQPTLEFIRPLPASAIIPAAIIFLGLSNEMSTAVIAFGSIWPVLLASVHGFANVEPRLVEVSATLCMSKREALMKIGIPSAMADILAGARISLSIALILAIVTEMQASLPGLGQNILLAQRAFKSPELYAGVFMLGLLGFVANAALTRIEARVLLWRAPRS